MRKFIRCHLAGIFLPLAVCLLTMTGCATFQQASDLDLQVVNLQFRNSTAFETTAVFTLRAENESPDPITLTGGVFKFYVDGKLIGKGMWNERQELPRLGTATLPVEVHLRNIAMATRIRGIIEAKSVTVRTEATMFVASGGGERKVRVNKESSVAASDFTGQPAR